MFSLPVEGRVLGYVQYTATGTAANLTTIPVGAKMAYIVVSTAAIRWRDDGTAPTTAIGMPVTPTATAPADIIYAGNLQAFQYIAQTGSPVLDVSYYG